MSSLVRLLSIFDLYSEAEPIWTLEEIITETGFSRSTAYRYVKELCDSGLLLAIGNGAHVLGPRVIEFDRQIRNCDPLLKAADKVLPSLEKYFGDHVLLLCSLYGDKVLSIHQQPQNTELQVSYTRGRPMPLFYGATAKVILANLPERRLVKLFLDRRLEIAKAGLGSEWEDFKITLKKIRQAGYSETHGEVDNGMVGVGVAIFAPDNRVIGSLSLVLTDDGHMIGTEIVDPLKRGSEQITLEIETILAKHNEQIDSYSPVIPFNKIA